MRVTEYTGTVIPVANGLTLTAPPVPASFVAAKLIDRMRDAGTSIAYIARSEWSAQAIVDAIRCLDPDLDVLHLPPWDCLPYDRVPPSRQCMGRRMDALRVWQHRRQSAVFITSVDATLQKIPPREAIETSWFELKNGEPFDRYAFRNFVETTGYLEDGLVDEPGEFAFRVDVIDIFPAGQPRPMRILLDDAGRIAELRSYDPLTQRTVFTKDSMIFGPASEAIVSPDQPSENSVPVEPVSERRLFDLYGRMETVFDLLADTPLVITEGVSARLDSDLDIIADAQEAERTLRGRQRSSATTLYLHRDDWTAIVAERSVLDMPSMAADVLPDFRSEPDPRAALLAFIAQKRASCSIVLAGQGRAFDGLCRRIGRGFDLKLVPVPHWRDADDAEAGAVMTLACALEQGFVDTAANRVVVTLQDVLGRAVDAARTLSLAEPEIALGDVVVHEDHGIGILAGLEMLEIDTDRRDAARLTYRDGASLLVPMEDFGKLWRYGSEPDAVTLDRLHTDAWQKKQAVIAKDVRAAARHLKQIAAARRAGAALDLTPPRVEYLKFAARFPYTLTADQTAAIEAVLADLASGTVMNRLVCGDVGFGKTEVALRAAAAAALSGHQVVVVSPTTVLTRQHFQLFEKRFAGTGITVAMLSRVVPAMEAKQVKTDLAAGTLRIVVATQAILAKDVTFQSLGLLILDEEHRFGTDDKQALKSLVPHLHMLTMSATPIPRTLQTALIGIQDVSLLATPPSRRKPVRTSLSPADPATMRVALMREHRRGGQSFVVAPQIEDLKGLETLLTEIVPELTLRIAHGKQPAAVMDDVMVHFADGDGNVLLSTNIIESGLDVPLANTIFIWRADRFGLAQLHQMRGRVGRGRIQGTAYLLTEPDRDIADDTRRRLATLLENDRLGAGLAISFNDLDLRGGGDVTGRDQAGHMRVIGVSLYQKLLERAIGSTRAKEQHDGRGVTLNLGLSGSIPATYVPDAAIRLNLYARLIRATTIAEIDGFSQEYDDRFGDLPEPVILLLRLARLRLAASLFGVCRLDAGPRALAVGFSGKPSRKAFLALCKHRQPTVKDDRLIYDLTTETGTERLQAFEMLFDTER